MRPICYSRNENAAKLLGRNIRSNQDSDHLAQSTDPLAHNALTQEQVPRRNRLFSLEIQRRYSRSQTYQPLRFIPSTPTINKLLIPVLTYTRPNLQPANSHFAAISDISINYNTHSEDTHPSGKSKIPTISLQNL